jgi:hypothetical protein
MKGGDNMAIVTCWLCGSDGIADLWKDGYACVNEEACMKAASNLVNYESCPCFMGGSCPTNAVHLDDHA